MGKRIFSGVIFFLILPVSIMQGCHRADKRASVLSTHRDTIDYCVGIILGSNLRRDGFDTINTQLVSRGITDYIEQKKLLIPKEEAKKILMEYRGKDLKRRLLRKFEDNKRAGEKFLEENSRQPGVVTLPSGLQYKIIREGKGPKPGPKDLVKVHYRGSLVDGTVFEEHMTGEPIPFFVDRVIQGWKEALQMMPEGSHWKIFVPYTLGYGTEYSPASSIPPYSTLIFDLELVEVDHRE